MRETPQVWHSQISGGRQAVILDPAQVISNPQEHFVALPVSDLSLDFGEREMDDIMMMDFFPIQIVADVDPEFMKQVDLFGRKAWRMRSQIEDLFLAGRIEDFERDPWPRFRHPLPCKSDMPRLFGD